MLTTPVIVGLGILAYLLIGLVTASFMQWKGSMMIDGEKDFKVIISLWPAPVMLWLMENFIMIVTYPFGLMFRVIKVQKNKRFY